MTGNKQSVPITASYLPTAAQALQMYEQRGGSLTQWAKFGNDPLEGNIGPDYMSRAGPVSRAGVSLPGSRHVC